MAESLPPYIYGREAGSNEKVWTEAALRAALAERDAQLASLAQGVRVAVPTETMEQEFAAYYRRGFKAGASSRDAVLAQARAYVQAAAALKWRSADAGELLARIDALTQGAAQP